VLLLDTASYKYEPHWVPVDRLFAAMNTVDSESGKSRGWVAVGSGVDVVE
jgi:glutathione gamma-glutamylcysteinyltransferase